jgi:hypothetical protein
MGAFTSAISRIFSFISNALWKSTNTDAINQAVVENGIRNSKSRADKAHYANGQLQSQIILLRDQVKKQERKKQEIEDMLSIAARQNDEANGAMYAEQLSSMEEDLKDNQEQLSSLEETYKQNTAIIGNSLREIRKFEMEFEQTKVKVALGRQLEGLAELTKSSITELQGMVGGEMGQAMQQLRSSAASGQGQMKATLDLAKEMGASVRIQQEAKAQHGKMLFKEYQMQHGMVQKEVAAETAPAENKQAVKQKIATT